MADATNNSSGGGCLVGVIFIVIATVWIFNDGKKEIDKTGYIPHTQSVNLYMDENWLSGETRECTAFENTEDGTNASVPIIKTLHCPLGTSSEKPHNIEVKFWGRISRPDVWKSQVNTFDWRCKRDSESFTCYALD